MMTSYHLFALISVIVSVSSSTNNEFCSKDQKSCSEEHNKYSRESNNWSLKIKEQINTAVNEYVPCKVENCSCHKSVIDEDLAPFKGGITKELFDRARAKATKYQIIDGKLYREEECHFPARCAGVEHYLVAIAAKMPNLELALNTRDWPQINKAWGHPKAPVLSFSKTKDYYDIMYPAWSFWEGGPAISLYPTGIGRWDKHRISISKSAEKWPWEKKENKGFFRGSRTSDERDALVLLSRAEPDLVDAQYTKNQAWKSDMDTLYAPPASEVSFEEHCKYKYLFNYRGVAASFRFKHLFLCKSLVFHVGDQWLEFFYPSLKPWVHYVPISPRASQEDIKQLINFFKENDELANEIANRGFLHIWDHLTDKDVKCYWRRLLKKYAKLVTYDVVKDNDLKLIYE
ncbi:O-glucosyltransferase rumi homolog [Spodoptera frugiperda]|uniref:O-glucosyltransferase rumi homolog n=1 Tax=Spodoptera frugiperda TaxID=7108 RepID=A0A9R0CUE8_SPOFR|nr:O-glucosyltransferase rumi homolog [Spodoptera frugiperda]